jgi:hypothetical protein
MKEQFQTREGGGGRILGTHLFACHSVTPFSKSVVCTLLRSLLLLAIGARPHSHTQREREREYMQSFKCCSVNF